MVTVTKTIGKRRGRKLQSLWLEVSCGVLHIAHAVALRAALRGGGAIMRRASVGQSAVMTASAADSLLNEKCSYFVLDINSSVC
ncbi:hypothetical protein MNBD_ALPHA08-141 [hydrothermal vent metagenome]|uniref:Uncharacterized protein n=1 Tax=hydrothermal vent metagenome TaxID=652676 RepID=A0A3B0R8M5_9ZZZZ